MQRSFGACLWLCFFLHSPVQAHDSSHPHAHWYNSQLMNEAAAQRLGVNYRSCCDQADVFQTRFRVGAANQDQWEYLKDGVWRVIPADIVKEEDTPDRQPVLFINRFTGQELCFFPPRGGM